MSLDALDPSELGKSSSSLFSSSTFSSLLLCSFSAIDVDDRSASHVLGFLFDDSAPLKNEGYPEQEGSHVPDGVCSEQVGQRRKNLIAEDFLLM